MFVLYKFAKLVDLLTSLVDLLVRIQEYNIYIALKQSLCQPSHRSYVYHLSLFILHTFKPTFHHFDSLIILCQLLLISISHISSFL